MTHESQATWSAGNDGFGYSEPESPPECTTPPVIREEIKILKSIAQNLKFPRWKRKAACASIRKNYGSFYMTESDSEWYGSRDTDSSEPDGSSSDGSDSSDSDGSDDSEQCPEKSSVPDASQISQSNEQQLLPDDSDAKSRSEGS